MIQLEGAGACREGIEFARQYPTLKGAWDACDRPEWLLWYVGRCPGTAKRSAQFARECADRAKVGAAVAAEAAWVAEAAAAWAWAAEAACAACAARAAEAVETAAAERAWVCGRIHELFADLWAEGGVL